ncbi:hypothetical protein PCANC_16777 [Puccinia coronata f. sp. avenae]|uniref:Uncharacterized protein n=1 Tax=Puccinia coronata f. sp. avenae TaxID=200324 RepID=A0A2N5V6F5_9BASI|nr:hypothetical protein PCANC_16777 [Puccinia coronata f. sp. avenae]PLW45562.1 hypothetical protein PCASD_06283 [Puccinia coronata f. sp. avenae]
MAKSEIKILEELKGQLTQPNLHSGGTDKKDDSGPSSISDEVQDPTQLTSPALAVLLEENGQFAQENEEREDISTRTRSRNEELALALEVLSLVFRKLKLAKRNLQKQPTHVHSSALPPQVLRQIATAIWAHWNVPSPTISYKSKNALKSLLEYMNTSRINFPQSSVVQFFLESVQQSILIEKRSLSILLYLLPHLSLEEALQAFQLYAPGPAEFLGTVLSAIGDDKLASVIGQLAVQWTVKVEGWDSKKFTMTELSPHLRSDWISVVFSILFSSEERGRQYLCQYYLLPLFKSRPACFTQLTEKVASPSGPRLRQLTIADTPLDYLSGIIALARLNPRQVCTSTESSANHRGLTEPWLPDSLLKVALSHPAVSLRSGALAIICQTTAPTSRLPLHHLDLALQFFAWNFGEVEAELKQNIFSNLNVLFNRLRDSSNSTKKKLVELLHKKSNLNKSRIEAASMNDLEASQLQNMIVEAEAYLEAVQAFILKFLKLCRSNLTISSPYRCQMASLTYLQVLLNTGIDPLYIPTNSSLSNQEVRKPTSFSFEVKIMDQPLTHKLVLGLTSTYVDVREASFTLLQQSCSLDSQFEEGSRLTKQVVSYALQCLNSRRESENCTATLLFRLILEKAIVRNAPVPSSLLPRKSDQHASSNPIAMFLLGRLDDLEDRVLASETNLGKACEAHPTAGSLMLISELFKCLSRDMIASLVASNELKDIMERTRKLVLRVWRFSAVVLCHSSDRQTDVVPDHEEARAFEFISAEDEGDVLEDEGDLPDRNLGNKHKTILSACWRSMKEASALLMQTVRLSLMAEKQSMSDNRETFFNYKDLNEIGELFEEWLLEIRHRGAFGAIHASYSSLCDSLCALPREASSSQLPLLWLKAHISAITSRKISTTRRSAGLPYCILSACQALSKSSPRELKDSLSSILSLGESQHISSEVQVHILNTLKILLTDGKVSSHFNSVFIERSFDLAIKSFVSLDWKVRNGALILFSGLTNRVFGTRSLTLDRSHINLCKRESLSDFSRRLPRMPSILLNELRRSTGAGIHVDPSSHSHGPIFAVLTLLALLQNPDCAPVANEFLPLVRECLSSKVSKVRSIGADAMTGLIPSNQVPALICDLLTEAVKSRCHNEVHGLLLLTHRLIQVPKTLVADEKSKILKALVGSAPMFLHCTSIPLVSQSSFLEILASLETRFGIRLDSSRLFSSDLLMERVQELRSVRAPALNSYEAHASRNILGRHPNREIVLKLLHKGSTPTLITVFCFLEKDENRMILNDPEIIDAIFLYGRQPTHSISVRLPALKLLALGSHSKAAANWPLEDLFRDYQSCLALPMRNSLLILSGSFLLNPFIHPGSHGGDLSSVHTWTDHILDKINAAAHEDQSTETRLSAVEALTVFLYLLKTQHQVLSIKIKLRILDLSINLIEDDDDEIRASLIARLYETKLLSSSSDPPLLNTEDGDDFQLELVPNLILEKLIHLATKLNPFFGFKKLLKREDFQADLDQMFEQSNDLFMTERLNLYKDDFLEFDLIQRISLDVLRDGTKLSNPEGNQEGEANEEKHNFDEEVTRQIDLRQEIKTFKYLMDVVVPASLTHTKGTANDLTDPLLFHNFLQLDDKKEHDDEFNLISYKAWFSLMTRLFHSIAIFKSFPKHLQYSLFSQMIIDLHLPPQDTVVTLEEGIDERFRLIEKFLNHHYY